MRRLAALSASALLLLWLGPSASLRVPLLSPRKPSPGNLILVRHGTTAHDDAYTFTGWSDPDINQHGEEQVKKAAIALMEAGYSFDVAYTSVLKRSIHTTAAAG